jgi:hypothetical protein
MKRGLALCLLVLPARLLAAEEVGPKLTHGKFQLFLGKWTQIPDFSKMKPLREGPLDDNLIQWKFDDYKNEFGIRFWGNHRPACV